MYTCVTGVVLGKGFSLIVKEKKAIPIACWCTHERSFFLLSPIIWVFFTWILALYSNELFCVHCARYD